MKIIIAGLLLISASGCLTRPFASDSVMVMYECPTSPTDCDKAKTWYPIATQLSGIECATLLPRMVELSKGKAVICRHFYGDNSSGLKLPVVL